MLRRRGNTDRIGPANALAALLASGTDAKSGWVLQTYFDMITVDGRPPPAMNPVGWGEWLTATEANLRVAADGSVLGCWPTRHEQLEAGKKRRILAPDPCKAWPTGTRTVRARPGRRSGARREGRHEPPQDVGPAPIARSFPPPWRCVTVIGTGASP